MSLALTYALADQHFERTKSVGILNVSLGLLRGLLRQAEVGRLTLLANPSLPLPSPVPPGFEARVYRMPLRGRLGRLWWDQWGVYTAARRAGHPWLVLPKGFASFLRPCPVRLAAYVHDTIPLYYRAHHPRAYPRGEGWYFSRCFRATLRQAAVIFTNTEFTRQCVLEAAREQGLPAPRVVVAGIGFEEPAASLGHAENRILCLAGPWPHKLTAQAVDFLERWRVQEDFRGSLEVVGRLPRGVALPSAAAWHGHERLPEAVFRDLLRRSRILVYFSEMEGFGMPPVEAVLSGVVPVYSDIPAHREVMGQAGCAFANGDYAAFVRAMETALGVTPAQVAEWRTALLARHHWGAVMQRVVAALSRPA
ncbi:MAG: glycosyltransferase [Verrucomicrobiae bacterium]|nr:glycosyltransferase [Verrucomicrobiae bacterium]